MSELPIDDATALVRAVVSLALMADRVLPANASPLARRLQEHLGTVSNFILRNHGLLTVGRSIPDAFLTLFNLQRACEIQLAAQGQGAELIPVSEEVLKTVPGYVKAVTRGAGSALSWAPLLRKLDRMDPSYKT